MNQKVTALIEAAAERHLCTVEEILGPSRMRVHCTARREIAIELQKAGWSLGHIARVLGGRHHTSVLNSLRRTKTIQRELIA